MKKLFFLILLVFVGCTSDDPQPDPVLLASTELVRVELMNDGSYLPTAEVIGETRLYQVGRAVRLDIDLSEMTPNTSKAVHIHQGSLEEPGRHWNAGYLIAACDSISLGRKWQRPNFGDVGNVDIDESGTGSFSLSTDRWEFATGSRFDILGLPIIIHEMPEDFANECDINHKHDTPHNNQKIGGGILEEVNAELMD